MVNSQPGNYKVGADDVLELKNPRRYRQSNSGYAAASFRRSSSKRTWHCHSSATVPNGYPSEVGVYLRQGDEWVEYQPEVVNWKTGGVIKSTSLHGHREGRCKWPS